MNHFFVNKWLHTQYYVFQFEKWLVIYTVSKFFSTTIIQSKNPKTMNATFKNITANLMVEDVDKTADYYKDMLGFKIEMSVPRDDGKLQWAMVTRDSVELMLHEKNNLLEEVPQLEGSRIGGSLTLFIEIEGLNAFYSDVKQKGAAFIKEPHTTFYGMNEFTLQDINGYVLTFAEPEEKTNQ